MNKYIIIFCLLVLNSCYIPTSYYRSTEQNYQQPGVVMPKQKCFTCKGLGFIKCQIHIGENCMRCNGTGIEICWNCDGIGRK